MILDAIQIPAEPAGAQLAHQPRGQREDQRQADGGAHADEHNQDQTHPRPPVCL